MDEGDVLHMLIKDETGSTISWQLVAGVDDGESVPGKPQIGSASDITSNAFTANWYYMENTEGFYLDVATDDDFTSFVVGYENKDVGFNIESSVVGLNQDTSYYFRIRAYNDYGTSVNSDTATLITNTEANLVDKDGNIYNIITIGTQKWTIENLKTTTYADGTAIPNIAADTLIDSGPLITSWLNSSFDTFTSVGTNITSAISDGADVAEAQQVGPTFAIAAHSTITIVITGFTLNSGTAPKIIVFDDDVPIVTEDDFLYYGDVADGNIEIDVTTAITSFGILITANDWDNSNPFATDFSVDISASYETFTGWQEDTTGAYCWYSNNIAYKTPYGALYNKYAVDNAHGLVYFERDAVEEVGWRVPSAADWATLIAYLGGIDFGYKLKEVGITYWTTPNTGASDDYGFAGVGGGKRDGTAGAFSELNEKCYFWVEGIEYAYYLEYSSIYLVASIMASANGLTVRCVNDV